VIHKVGLHQRGTARWISAPGEKQTDGNYKGLVEFTSREVANNFRRQVLLALQEQGLA
jgi:DNA-binding cell septation regulator SpoVG